jgi:hypothetical protein
MEIKNMKLENGDYMLKDEVLDYCNFVICKPSLAMIINKCRSYSDEYGRSWFKANDIKSMMMPDLFREMECNVSIILMAVDEYEHEPYQD